MSEQFAALEHQMLALPAPPSILVYSTPTCPDCRALKAWLAEHKLPYEERDLTDPAIADEARARTGVRVAPITIIGQEVFYGSFASQRPRLEASLPGLKPTAA